jgi:signal transduction histidine kinase
LDVTTAIAGLTPEARARAERIARESMGAGVPWELELDFVRRDGDHRWILVRGVADRGPDGEIVGAHGTVQDITERKRTEEDLRRFGEALERRVAERTAELEAANEELRSFSYTVSHDLRAPVRAVAGFAGILARDHAAHMDEEARHHLQNIREAGEAMGRLIDDLLAYTRVGRATVQREPVDLDALGRRVEFAFGARAREAGGAVIVEQPLHRPLGDPTLVEEILVNLVDNALSYARPGVRPEVRILTTRDGASVTLSVADNGRGIPPEAQEHIFELFSRAAPADAEQGTGIGLAIVRKAARSMGSDLRVSSTVGAGTTFSLSLPAAD